MKTRKGPLGKLNRKTGQTCTEFAHCIFYIEENPEASGRDARSKLISVSLQMTKIRTSDYFP